MVRYLHDFGLTKECTPVVFDVFQLNTVPCNKFRSKVGSMPGVKNLVIVRTIATTKKHTSLRRKEIADHFEDRRKYIQKSKKQNFLPIIERLKQQIPSDIYTL